MSKFKRGNIVEIINSPYDSIPNGTQGKITKVIKEYLGKSDLITIEEFAPDRPRLFYDHEVKFISKYAQPS